MIVSHSHSFIYLRTRKTASTALEIALSTVCGSQDVITPFCPRDEGVRAEAGGRGPQNLEPRNGVVPRNHLPAESVRAFVGDDVWARYRVFSVDRDPLEKVVSLHYHRHKQEPRPGLDEFVGGGEAFDAFNWPIYSIQGRPAVDWLGNYDRLTDFVGHLEDQVGVRLPPLVAAKRQFREDPRPAHQILPVALQARVRRAFAAEPDFHGTSHLTFDRTDHRAH
jgi:hypothetical protein